MEITALVRDELVRRFGDDVSVEYVDITEPTAREPVSALVAEVTERGLLYPVTFVDGSAVYDGAVSYPAIVRSVEGKLTQGGSA